MRCDTVILEGAVRDIRTIGEFPPILIETIGVCYNAIDLTGKRHTDMPDLPLTKFTEVPSRLKQMVPYRNDGCEISAIVLNKMNQNIETLPFFSSTAFCTARSLLRNTVEAWGAVYKKPVISSLPVEAAKGVSIPEPPSMALPAVPQAADFQNTLIGFALDQSSFLHGKSLYEATQYGDVDESIITGINFQHTNINTIRTEVIGAAAYHAPYASCAEETLCVVTAVNNKSGNYASDDMVGAFGVALNVSGLRQYFTEWSICEGAVANWISPCVQVPCVINAVSLLPLREITPVDIGDTGKTCVEVMQPVIELLVPSQKAALLAALNRDKVEYGFPSLPSIQDFDVSKLTVLVHKVQ